MFWEWKKKCSAFKVYISSFFFPLEVAGFCGENSCFGPEHEIVEIDFGSCSTQPLFSTFPSTSWHVFSVTWREDPEEIDAHQAPWHHTCFLSMLPACGPALGCASVSPGCRYPASMFEHSLGDVHGRVPFPESSATQRQALAAWFYWWVHWLSQLSSELGVQHFSCSAPGQWRKTVP